MKLRDLGEFNLIKKIEVLHSKKSRINRQILGIGDDCAVFPKSGTNGVWLVSTDMLIEGTHFLYDKVFPKDLGYKTLAVNLSDIAAMGGTPRFSFLSMALPKDLPVRWIENFLKGYKKLADRYSVLLLGGDTTHSPDRICLNVTIIGEARKNRIKLRSMARPGDLILVTDFLGDSAAGLQCLIKNIPGYNKLVRSHYLPKPQIEEGFFVANHKSVHAMIDMSDGLAADLTRVMERSHCGISIDIKLLPISKKLQQYSRDQSKKPLEFILGGGEDYTLLFSCEKSGVSKLMKAFKSKFKRPLYIIGEVTGEVGNLEYRENGQKVNTHFRQYKGYDHFHNC